MKVLQSSIVLTIIFTQTVFSRRHNRMGNQNAIMSVLQNMMGPQNYERAMSMMPMENRLPCYKEPMPIAPENRLPFYKEHLPIVPENRLPFYKEHLPIVPENRLPFYKELMPIVPENQLPFYKEHMLIMPQQVIPREINMPISFMEQKYPCPTEAIYPILAELSPKSMAGLPLAPNMPATVPLSQMAIYPQAIPEMVTLPVSYPAMPVQEKPGCACSCHSPAPLVSPFLPSASPISPWAPPTSSLLPPVVPNQVKSHFLRKIPIPPPTL